MWSSTGGTVLLPYTARSARGEFWARRRGRPSRIDGGFDLRGDRDGRRAPRACRSEVIAVDVAGAARRATERARRHGFEPPAVVADAEQLRILQRLGRCRVHSFMMASSLRRPDRGSGGDGRVARAPRSPSANLRARGSPLSLLRGLALEREDSGESCCGRARSRGRGRREDFGSSGADGTDVRPARAWTHRTAARRAELSSLLRPHRRLHRRTRSPACSVTSSAIVAARP